MTREITQPVTVVIPHRGADSTLENCVQALRKQSYPREMINVLLVINEPHFRELSFGLENGEHVLFQRENYSYAARNLGINMSKTEFLAFTDSDTQPTVDWLLEGVRSLLAGADLVAGGIELRFTSEKITASGLYEKLFAFDQERNVRLGQSVTANLFASRRVFEKYGLFDSSAISGEDFEWTRAAVSAGANLVFNPKALVFHPAREQLLELIKKTHRTTWHFPQAPKGQSTFLRVTRRAWGQLAYGPSSARTQSMKIHHRVIAHMLRVFLVGIKALILSAYFIKQLYRR